MTIIGCDLHTRFQQIAMREEARGEIEVRRLEQERGAARRFYAPLSPGAGVGIEASGATQWFERRLAEWGQELWVGEPAEIRARMMRQQKTDTGDAEPLLELLLRKRFPGVGVASREERDRRQLLPPRDKRGRRRTAVKNQRHGLARGPGRCRQRKRWNAPGRRPLQALELDPGAPRRRQELLALRER